MGLRTSRLVRSRERAVRSAAALLLGASVSASGFVALAEPAHAAAPNAPVISDPAATVTSRDRTPAVTFSGSGTQYECSASQGAPSYSDCSSPWAVPSLSTDGVWTLSIREKAVANDGDPAIVTYTLDTTASLTVTPPASPGSDPRPSWAVSTDASGSVSCSLDGGAGVDCTSGFTPTADLTEGSHSLEATATDPLGNTSPVNTTTYVLDTTKPAAPTVAGASGIGNNQRPSWSWTNPESVAALCTLTTPSGAGSESGCGSTTSYTAPTQSAQGDYSLSVVLVDPAGNRSDAGTSPTYTLDTVPSAPAVFGPGQTSPSTDPSVTWTFTEPGASSSCSLQGAKHSAVSLGTCTSPVTVNPLAGDDAWTLAVTENDGHGNLVTTVGPTYVLDTTGPDAPVISAPSGLSNVVQPHITWTGELPSTAVCRWERTVGAVVTDGSWVDCTARFFDPVLPGDGSYTFQAVLTDPLNNPGTLGTTTTPYVYDGTAPDVPVLTVPATPGNDPAPSVTFSPETPGGTADCAVWSGTTAPASPSWSDCTTGVFQPTLPADGTWTLAVRLADAAGNQASPATFTYVLDRTSPPAVAITGYSGPSNDKTPTFGLVDNPTLTITCQMWFGPNVTGTKVGGKGPCPDASGQFTSSTLNKGDGLYTLEVTAKSKAGNTTISTSPFTLDTTAPNAPVVTGPTGTHNYAAPTWTFPVQTGTTAQCQLVQGLAQSNPVDCSSGSFTVTNPADGTYTVNVQVTDLASNAAPLVTTAAYTSDRTVPAAPVVSGPTGPGNAPAPTWTWTGEAGVTATCRLDRAGVVGSAVPCNSGSFKPTLTGDTSYVVVVQLTDAAGNASPATTTAAYLLDTVVPAAPVISGPTGASPTATVTWSWTAEAGATSKCVLIRNGVAGAPVTCTSDTAMTLPSDATYVLQVTVVDPAGNASPSTQSSAYVLDRVAPLAPAVNTPVSPAKDPLPAFSYSAEAGATVQCRLTRSGALVKDWSACTSPLVDLTSSPDGTYVLDVRATDAAGNVGAVGSSLGYVFDTTPPATAVVTVPSSPSQSPTPTITWTAEAGATATCKLAFNGVVPATSVACSSPWTPTLPADGSYVARVRLTDLAGNLALASGLSAPYVLDTTPPTVPVVTAPAALGRSTAPSWSATYESGATAECRLTSGATVVADWTSCALPYVTDLSALPDATYTFGVRVTDAVGLVSPVGSASYQLDTTAPAAPVFVATPPSPGKTRALSFAFTSDPGTTTYCKLTSGATVISPETTCTSPLPVSLTGLADGPYTLSARSVDAATNNGPTQTATYVLDTTAPAAPALLSGPAATAPDTTPTWTFTAEAGTTLTCKVVGTAGFATSGTCTSPYKPTLPTDDTYTFTVTATDAALNTSAPLTRTYVLDATAPATADVTGPKSPGKAVSPTWTVTSAEGQTQCLLVKGASTVVRDWANCGPTFSVLLPGDGTYTLSARVQDSAGNFSPVVTSVYVLDTVSPGVATIVTPGSPSTDRAPTFVISSTDASVTAQCQVTGPAGVISAFANCPISAAGSDYNLDLSAAADGSYTLTVRLTDAAGNTGGSTSGTYVLDSSAPNAVLVTAPATPAQDDTPSWGLVGDTDATLECMLSGPGFTSPAFADCPTDVLPGTGSFTADLTAKGDGTYTLTARSRDAAGNLGPETSSSYELDRTPPATPAAPTVPFELSNDPSVTWTFSVDPGATAHCTLSSASSVVTSDFACASPLTTTLTGDGTYTLTLTAVDPAGNVSGAAKATYTYDSTAPSAPTVNDLPSPNPNASPAWTFAASEPGDTVMCELEGMPSAAFVPCTSPVSYDLPAEGAYTLHVYEIDAAGNRSGEITTGYQYDAKAVLGAIVYSPDPAIGHSTSPAFQVAVDPLQLDTIDHLECEVTIAVTVGAPATTAPVSPCTANVPNTVDLSALAPGTEASVVLGVRTYAKSGQTQGQSAKATYAFDNRPPPSPRILEIADHGRSNKVSWSWAGQDTDRETFVCTLTKAGTTPLLTKATTCGGVNTGTKDVTIASTSYGVWTLTVWAVDAAGNASVLPASSSYDYLPPIPTLVVKSLTSGSDPTPTWAFTVPRGYTAACIVSSSAGKQLFTGDCSTGRVTVDLTDEPAGTYSLSVQLADSHEETGAFSKPATYRYAPRTSNDTHLGHTGPTTPTTPHRGGGGTGPTVTPVGGGNPHGPGGGTVVPSDPTPPHGTTGSTTSNPATGANHTGSKPGTKSQAGSGLPLPGGLITKEATKAIGNTLAQVAQKPTIPLVLFGVVVGFLLLQNRIDRRDPKLASAPVGAEPELDFGPIQGLGGATA